MRCSTTRCAQCERGADLSDARKRTKGVAAPTSRHGAVCLLRRLGRARQSRPLALGNAPVRTRTLAPRAVLQRPHAWQASNSSSSATATPRATQHFVPSTPLSTMTSRLQEAQQQQQQQQQQALAPAVSTPSTATPSTGHTGLPPLAASPFVAGGPTAAAGARHARTGSAGAGADEPPRGPARAGAAGAGQGQQAGGQQALASALSGHSRLSEDTSSTAGLAGVELEGAHARQVRGLFVHPLHARTGNASAAQDQAPCCMMRVSA